MPNTDKKIVFFVGALREGGAERVISILSDKMVVSGNPVEILLYYDAEVFYRINPDIKIVCVTKETGSKNLLKNLLWIRKYFSEQASIVLSFLAVFNIIAVAATLFTSIPLIVADRNDPRFVPENKYVRWLRDFLYRFADGVVLQTKHNQNYFPWKVRDKSTIIYNPIDLGPKAGLALKTEKRKEIVSVGRLMPQKNQEMLLEAFAQVHQSHPEHTLVIYGEGPCRVHLEQLAKALGLEDFVKLPGSVKELHERIVGAELFVLSSNYEGMPNALTEAMCLGLPVVSTEVSGATDLIKNGKNGLLVPCGDAKELAAAMGRMLSDTRFRMACAEQAVRLNERLAVDNICAEWMDYVRSVQ